MCSMEVHEDMYTAVESVEICLVSPPMDGTGKRLWEKVKYQLVEYHSLPNLICNLFIYIWDFGTFRCYLQKRVLNVSRGPAVRALRAQTDKREYSFTFERQVSFFPFQFTYPFVAISIYCHFFIRRIN